MKILISGASGFVGKEALRGFAGKGHELRALIRDVAKIEREFAKDAAIDWQQIPAMDDEEAWGRVLHDVDIVVHLAARVHVMRDHAADPLLEFRKANVAGSEHLARLAARHGAKRLVYVSTVKVNGEATFGGRRFSEMDVRSLQDLYSISKQEAEQVLLRVASETGLEVVIVRPPLVYGAEVKGHFIQMLRVLSRGIPLPLASAQNLRSLIYVKNLVDALIVCATHPAAAGKTYLVSDGEDISTSDLLRRLGAEMGQPARLVPCPPSLLKLLARLIGKSAQVERLLGSLQVDSGKIRSELSWTPPYSLQQGLKATAEWYRNAHL
jgi:nucleoside-diphosphate-sugar epimerase